MVHGPRDVVAIRRAVFDSLGPGDAQPFELHPELYGPWFEFLLQYGRYGLDWRAAEQHRQISRDLLQPNWMGLHQSSKHQTESYFFVKLPLIVNKVKKEDTDQFIQ